MLVGSSWAQIGLEGLRVILEMEVGTEGRAREIWAIPYKAQAPRGRGSRPSPRDRGAEKEPAGLWRALRTHRGDAGAL